MAIQLNFEPIFSAWPMWLAGLLLTIQLSAVATVLGFAGGSLVAVARRSPRNLLRRSASVYVELIRNTPFLIQLFLVYFGLAMLGLRFPAFVVAVVALTINTSAYTSEIVRAGLDAVKKGQWEAGESLGLSRPQVYWHVAFRPAVEWVYPSLCSQFVILLLATSITSQISVEELTAVANYIQSETYRPFESYISTAFIYILLSMALRLVLWVIGLLAFPRRRRLGISA